MFVVFLMFFTRVIIDNFQAFVLVNNDSDWWFKKKYYTMPKQS